MAICRKCGRRFKRKNVRRHPQYRSAQDVANDMYSHLISIEITIKTLSGIDIKVKKYPHHASELLKDIIAREETFPFPIYLSDLTPLLINILLDTALKDYIISKVVQRIIKEANPDLYDRAKKIRGAFPYQWIIC
jgi:hypothetical protein